MNLAWFLISRKPNRSHDWDKKFSHILKYRYLEPRYPFNARLKMALVVNQWRKWAGHKLDWCGLLISQSYPIPPTSFSWMSQSEELRYFVFNYSCVFNRKQEKNDYQFTEHFWQKLLSGITRSGVSRHQGLKIFVGSMPPPDSLEKSRFGEVLRLGNLSSVCWFLHCPPGSSTGRMTSIVAEWWSLRDWKIWLEIENHKTQRN